MTDRNAEPVRKAVPVSPDENPLNLLFVFEQLKDVERRNPLSKGSRRENTAEHSWSVALAALIFESGAAEEVDVSHAVALAVAHDLAEAFVGDTFVYGDGADSRAQREDAAMESFLAATRSPAESKRLVSLWREFEANSTPEARYVLALDVLLPVFMNGRNLEHSSWKAHGVRAEDVRARVRSVEATLPALAAEAYKVIDLGVRHGALGGP